MILCLGMTPALQRVMVFDKFEVNAVNRAVRTLDGPAGKSVNVAKILKTLGQDVVACGFFGGARGRFILNSIQIHGVKTDFIEIQNTRQCITLLDQAHNTHTELVEESPVVSPESCQSLFGIYQKHLVNNCRAVVLSGTLAPGAPADFYLQCLQLANKHKCFTVVDAQKEPLLKALAAKPSLVKPNRHELGWTVNKTLKTESQVTVAIQTLHELGAQRVVVTHGSKPTLAFDGKTFWKITPPKIKAVNPIGSGDSATAAMVVHLLKGDDLGESTKWGAAAGAANALTLMAAELKITDMTRLAKEVEVEKFSA